VLGEEHRETLRFARIGATIGHVSGPVTDVRAGALLRRYHQRFGGEELPVPVEAIAEDLCGLVIEEGPDIDVSGMLMPLERRIYVNSTEPSERRRFTLAHELGHWICQYLEGLTESRYCRANEIGLDPQAKAIEREANVFAAELLMPAEEVRGAWVGSVSACAKAFGVSGEAVHWRLYNLGLVTDQPSRIAVER
jgi:Zn-dependent peptidase ImmA (M78 family)